METQNPLSLLNARAQRKKSADAKGKPTGKQTAGLLRRRHVRVEQIIYIGKESNRLEEIEAGVIHSPQSFYTEYPDPRREEWQTKILPVLKRIPIAALMRFSGRSHSMLLRTRTVWKRFTRHGRSNQNWFCWILDFPG